MTALRTRQVNNDGLADLTTVTLGELNAVAALQERVDRKYVLTQEQTARLVAELGSRLAVLDMGGRRSFGYRSVYFDTESLESYLAAAHRRRRRFKVRTRCYLDTNTAMLEVKTRGARNQTIKHRQIHEVEHCDLLGQDGRAFVNQVTGRDGLGAMLRPTLTSSYRRTTLVDRDDVARLTIDSQLRCTDWRNRQIHLADRVVVETKSAGAPSAADRWLWAHHIRPEKISKYGTGLAALHPELPSNKWHRTLKRHFTAPAGRSDAAELINQLGSTDGVLDDRGDLDRMVRGHRQRYPQVTQTLEDPGRRFEP